MLENNFYKDIKNVNISNYDFVMNLQNILNQILLNNDLKKTRKKEYESFVSLITNINGYEDKFNTILITLEILITNL